MEIVSIGEILIDMFPSEVGRKMVEVTSFYPNPGGACANVAVAAARLGKTSAFIGKVGDDFFGCSLIDTLKKNGVEISGMRVDEKARTTVAFIAMPDENTAEFIFFRNPGADLCLKIDDLDIDLVERAKILHCGSLILVDEPARSAQFKAVETARNRGAIISFDVNYRPGLWNSHLDAIDQIKKMLPLTDLLKVNESELELLSGSRDPLIGGKVLLSRGPKLVAVTLGIKGSFYLTEKATGFVPPFIINTVDAIGCGDAFIGALLSRLVDISDNQLDLGENELLSLFTFANAAGAFTALSHGVIPALPTALQLNDFINNFSRIKE